MAKVNKRINTLTQLTDSNISMSGNLPIDLNNSEQTNRIKLSDTIKTPYATCNTAAATAVKVCEIQNFKDFALVGSLPIAVKFTYQNTAENVKLQIKYTDADGSVVTLDAKNAYAMNSPEKAIGYGDIPASSFVEFYYDSVADCFYMTDAPCGFGLGTCPTNTASATSQPTLAVTLSNNNAIALPTGYAFKVSFTYNYAYAGQPLMSVNGGTALPVTVGGVAAGAGAFAAGRSYTFIATGSNFDCLSQITTVTDIENFGFKKLITDTNPSDETDFNRYVINGLFSIGNPSSYENIPLKTPGVLQVFNCGVYRMQQYTTRDNITYVRLSTNYGVTWNEWQKLATESDLKSTTTQINLTSGTSTEPTRCTYTVTGKTCIVNLSGFTDTGTGLHHIAENLPMCQTRANLRTSEGVIIGTEANGTYLFTTGAVTNMYTQLIYPIA